MRDDFIEGKIGKKYDVQKEVFSFSEDIQYIIGRQLKRHFEDKKNKEIKILEIGPGLGNTTLEILAADERIKITSVDNSELMIKQFIKKRGSFDRVKLVNQDILTYLKNNNEIYHGIVSALTLHNFNKEYRNEVLRYCLENLQKNGIFVNGDKYSQDNFFIRNYHTLIELNMFAKGLIPKGEFKLLIDWIKHYKVDARKDIIMKEKESIAYMIEIGFKKINVVYRNHLEAIICAYK